MKNIKLAADRRQRIIELLTEDGSARVKELSQLFQVSEPTIRTDLAALEEEGLIIRKHGGAFLKIIPRQVSDLLVLNNTNIEKKQKIARKALEFISDEDSIILDSGSTVTELARLLPGTFDWVQVVTNALNIALLLGQHPEFDIYLIGGAFKAPTLSTTGDKALNFFDSITTRTVFLATGGVSKNGELSYPSIADIPLKKAMIEAADRVVLLADSTKFYKSSFAVLDQVNRVVDYLITDEDLAPHIQRELTERGAKIIIA